MPLEVEISSLRVLMKSRYEQLNMISEKRLVAICHYQLYQKEWLRHLIRKFDRENLENMIWC